MYMELHHSHIEHREGQELAWQKDDAIKCYHIATLYISSKR